MAVPRDVLSGRQSDEVQGWQTQDESISGLYPKGTRGTSPKHVKTHQLGLTPARQEGSATHSQDADSGQHSEDYFSDALAAQAE